MSHSLLEDILQRLNAHRGLVFGMMIITALIAFEIFNYTTTEYAFTDLLGDLEFLSISWATILAAAFCAIDFAGIARLFTPERDQEEASETWYLFGAWLLAATMNAILTWWGVSLAVLNHETLGNAIIDRATLLRIVPIFVAIMVWLIRVLILGTFSLAGDRLFSQQNVGQSAYRAPIHDETYVVPEPASNRHQRVPQAHTIQASPKYPASGYRSRGEPTYPPRSAQLSGSQQEAGQKELF